MTEALFFKLKIPRFKDTETRAEICFADGDNTLTKLGFKGQNC